MLVHLSQREVLDKNEQIAAHSVRHEGNEERVTRRRWNGRRQRRMRVNNDRRDF